MSKPLSATSFTSSALNWLTNSRHPRILHVFDNACNLINEDKNVLSVVNHQIGNGPFNIVIQDEVLFSDHLNIESPVFIFNNQLKLGNVTILVSDVELWNPRPDWATLHTKKDDIKNQIFQLRITNYQSLPISLTSAFFNSLAIADISAVKETSSKLAGLGIGLTPSGDDFMIGAMYAAWIIHPPEIASELTKAIAEVAAPLTTSLSAAWLRSAGRGEAGILWHEFFDALMTGNESKIQLQINKIISVGETSGADALSGFVSLCKY